MREDTRCQLSFTLAKMYEDIGKLDEAFSLLYEGNSLRKKLLGYSIDHDVELFKKLKATKLILLKNKLEVSDASSRVYQFLFLECQDLEPH